MRHAEHSRPVASSVVPGRTTDEMGRAGLRLSSVPKNHTHLRLLGYDLWAYSPFYFGGRVVISLNLILRYLNFKILLTYLNLCTSTLLPLYYLYRVCFTICAGYMC